MEYYLPAFYLMGRLHNVVVVDPGAETVRPRNTNAFFSAAEFRTADYVDFLDGLSATQAVPECIVIALPNRLHVDAARRALATDRHVLCEKPLALVARDCAELKALASSRKRLLKVAMSRRYLAALRLLREVVLGGELGEVLAIHVHDRTPFLWTPRSFGFFDREGGGVLADIGAHYLDYVETLLGPLTPVSYTDDARGGIESSLHYRLAAGDVQVDIELSRIHQSGAWLTVVCARGEIRVDKSKENEAVIKPTGRPGRRIVVEHPFQDPRWPASYHGSFVQMLSDLERSIAGEDSDIADVADAVRTAGLIEWAYTRRDAELSTGGKAVGSHASARVLVTGGTGFIGGHLVERLTGDGAPVRVAVRSPAKCANVTRFSVELRSTDLLDPQSVKAAVDGVRTVYHLAYGNDGADRGRITIEGTRNVVDAAIAAGAECVVLLSTMYVFGFPEASGAIDESYPYRPYGGEYGESKAKMEQWCLRRARTSGSTRIVVLNPTCVFGPGGGAYTCLPVDLTAQGRFCWINGGSGSANYNYVTNLVDAILAAAAVPSAHGERFIINDGTITWRELIEPFVEPLARAIPSFSVEEFARLPRFGGPFRINDLIRTALSNPDIRNVAKRSAAVRNVFALANRIWPRPPRTGDVLALLAPPVAPEPTSDPPEWLARLYSPFQARFSAEKANRVLGWRPRIGLRAAQAETIAWLVANGRLPS